MQPQRVIISRQGVQTIGITTFDAHQTLPPYKMSAKTGHKDAIVAVILNPAEMGLVPTDSLVPRDDLTPGEVFYRGIFFRDTPQRRNTGHTLHTRGMVCGMNQRCGRTESRSLKIKLGAIIQDINYDELFWPGGDGTEQIWVHMLTDGGWI